MPPAPQTLSDALAPNGWPRTRLQGFRAGERNALAEVYRDHVGELSRYLQHGFSFDAKGRALRFAGYRSSFELHDLVQESFRRAFETKARNDYDGIRPFSAWLKIIARNLVLKEFRRRDRLFVELNTGGGEGSEPAQASDAQDPEQVLHRARVARLVRVFVQTLGESERELLRLRFVEGVGQREAAEQLGIGRQRLRTREGKLREKLLRHLAQQGEDPKRLAQGTGDGALGVAGLLLGHDQLQALQPLVETAWFRELARTSGAAKPAAQGVA